MNVKQFDVCKVNQDVLLGKKINEFIVIDEPKDGYFNGFKISKAKRLIEDYVEVGITGVVITIPVKLRLSDVVEVVDHLSEDGIAKTEKFINTHQN